jgi:hypothetical protein
MEVFKAFCVGYTCTAIPLTIVQYMLLWWRSR